MTSRFLFVFFVYSIISYQIIYSSVRGAEFYNLNLMLIGAVQQVFLGLSFSMFFLVKLNYFTIGGILSIRSNKMQ